MPALDRRVALHVALLAAVVALVFSNSLHGELALESIDRVRDNPEIERVLPVWRHFVDPFTSSVNPDTARYRPLLPLSLSLDVALAEATGLARPLVHHAGNLLAHLVVTLLLYGLLGELLAWGPSDRPRDRRELALAGALFFAVHPVSGVPVNHVAARDLLLMTGLLFAALWVWARTRRRGDSIAGVLLALALFSLSLLATPIGVVAPLLVLAFELTLAGGSIEDRRVWRRAAWWLLPVVAFFVWTEAVLGFSDLERIEHGEWRPWIYALTMARVHVTHYLRNAVWPFEMRALPAIEPATGFTDPGVLAGLAVILGSLGCAWLLRQRSPLAAWSILAYWVHFAPTSSLRPLRSLVADSRQYPSLAFLCLLAVMALWRLPRRAAAGVVIVAVVYFAVASFALNRVWHTERSLWEHSVRHGAEPQAQLALAQAHDRLARAERRAGNVEAALAAALRAAELDPRNPEHQYLAAFELQQAGRLVDSLVPLGRLAELRPGFRDAFYLEGWARQRLGQWDLAEAAYRAQLERDPDHVPSRYNLGYGLQQAGRREEAVEAFEAVLALEADHAGARYWLDQRGVLPAEPSATAVLRAVGEGLEALGRQDPRAALAALDEAVRLDPRSAGAHRHRGYALLLLGRFEEAVAATARAVALAPDDLAARHNLGYASRKAGDPERAVEVLRGVVAEAPERIVSRYELAVALVDAGRPAEARAVLVALLEADPDHGAARQRLAELDAAGAGR